MATKAQALKVAKEFGFILEDDGMALNIDCPDGYISNAYNQHYDTIDLVQAAEYGERKPEIWADVIISMRMGMRVCDLGDSCEVGCPELKK